MTVIVDLIERHREKLVELCAHHRVRRLELFGSAVTGEFMAATSDLDFLVEFQPCAPVEHAECYFGLLEDLQRLFERPIDLVENGAVENPYFLRDVESSRRVLYAA